MRALWLVCLVFPCLPLLGLGADPRQDPDDVPEDPGKVYDVDAPTELVPRNECATDECHGDVKEHASLHGPMHVDACDSCHVLTDVEQHAFETAREAADLCLLCHRFSMPGAVEYPVVHEPLATGECLPCHDPHGGGDTNLLRGAKPADVCKNCHEDQSGGQHVVHGPVSAGACEACHEPHYSENENLLVLTGKDLCLRCHATIGAQIESQRVVHSPVLDSCETCHDPHASENDGLLVSETVSLCISCHEDVGHTLNTASTQHGATTSERSCVSCHDPHASDHPRLLRKDTASLCFECHDQVIERAAGGQLIDIKERIDTSTSLHGPTAEGDCVACHEIHGSDHDRLLLSDYSTEIYQEFEESTYAMCFTCHDRQAVLLAETDAVTGFRNGEENLHFVHVNREKGRSCRVCHDSHAADQEHHIRSEVPFGPGGWMLPIDWIPTENGGNCTAACHQPYAYDRIEAVVHPSPSERRMLEQPVPSEQPRSTDPNQASPGAAPEAEAPSEQVPEREL